MPTTITNQRAADIQVLFECCAASIGTFVGLSDAISGGRLGRYIFCDSGRLGEVALHANGRTNVRAYWLSAHGWKDVTDLL